MTTFPLLELPYPPLVKILRFLDNRDLVKVLRTCRSLKKLAQKNFWRRMVNVKVKRITNTDTTVLYKVQTAAGYPEEIHDMEYTWNKSDPGSLPFFLWFAEVFVNTEICHFSLDHFDFYEENVENLQHFWRQNRLKVCRITISESIYGNVENFVKFLSATHTRDILFEETDVSKTHVLLIDSFLEFIPSLEGLYVNDAGRFSSHLNATQRVERERELYRTLRLPNLPAHVQQIPKASDLSFLCIIDFDIIKREIHKWFHNTAEENSHFYLVSFEGRFSDYDVMLEALELPAAKYCFTATGNMRMWRDDPSINVLICKSNYSEKSDAFKWEFDFYYPVFG